MTTQYTTGPWKQEGYNIWAPGAKANVATVSDPYAGKYVEFSPVEFSSSHAKEAYANARLIASCPALLEVAKKMLAAIQRLRVCPLCKEPECDCWADSVAAIVNAEGEEETP